MNKLQRLVWLTGLFSVGLAAAARADPLDMSTPSPAENVTAEATQLSKVPEPATTVEEWMSQIQAQEQPDEASTELAQGLTQITAVQVSKTDSGLEL